MQLDIVIIDDNRIDRMLAARTIARQWRHASIREYDYADEALADLRSAPELRPDLILLDVRMPRMTGPEFLIATARDAPPGIAGAIVVMLTVPLQSADEEATDHPAFAGTIDKPLGAEDLDRIALMFCARQAGPNRVTPPPPGSPG